MKAVAGVVIATGFTLALVAAILHVAVPPNETAEEGPADPFLFVRRPVVKALEAAGLPIRARACLPRVGRSSVTEGREAGEDLPVCEMEVRREPVYRGLVSPVGLRVSYRLTYFRGHDEVWRAVRLCYAVGDRRLVATEAATPDPDVAEVSGFVPSSARGAWVEYTDDKGEVHGLDGWGDPDPFWRD